MKNVAVILAGGVGSRLNAGVPKQFLKVAGQSVIEHTISVFQNHSLIDEIAVVSHETYHQMIQELVSKNNFIKVKKILMSGTERHLSSLSAIKAYEGESDVNLIFHDSVRPLISSQIIDCVIDALNKYDAIDVAIPSADTIIQVSDDSLITDIPPRKYLRRGQTPQGFKLKTISEAYKRALADPDFNTTDDCGVVLKYLPDTKIFVVNGNDANMKLTYKEDLYLIEKLFQLKSIDMQIKELSDFDKQNLSNKVIAIFGASSGIGEELFALCENSGAKVYGYSRSLNGVDVRNSESVRSVLQDIYKRHGRIDYVVNTASVLYKEPLVHMDYSHIEHAIDLNYKGMVIVAKEAFPYLQESSGQLIFYTSSSYTRGRMDYSIYSSTKCATVNFVQALAEEWSHSRVRVNCINPERTKTPMRVKNFGIEPEDSLLDPKVVAAVSAKVLLSEITGQVIDVKIKSI